MARLSNAFYLRPLAVLRALLSAPRAIVFPIVAIGIVAVLTVVFNEWSVARASAQDRALTALIRLQNDVSDIRARLADTSIAFTHTRDQSALIERYRSDMVLLSTKLTEHALLLHAHTADIVSLSRLSVAALALLTLALLTVTTRLLLKESKQHSAARNVQLAIRHDLEDLVEQRNAELFALTTHLQEITEQEKAEVARDLHDELGGLLTAAQMDLAWLQSYSSARDARVHGKLADLNTAIIEAMNLKRRIVEGLRPTLLDHFGFAVAVRAHFEETCEKAGLRCQMDLPDNGPVVPQTAAIVLFRVAQESLTNILRHAKATSVEVTFEAVAGVYHLAISDDGIGIDLAAVDGTASHGLVGMRHRVNALKGKFAIGANYPHGTRIDVSIPISADVHGSVG